MKKYFFIIFLLIPLSLFGENFYSLQEINIKAKLIKSAKQKGDTLFTGISLDKNSLKLSGEGGKNSVYKAISILPDVNLDNDDPFGLSDKRLRIRGTSDYFIGITVDGIPNYGIMPIGPRDYIYDVENFDKIKVYPGATPSDLMTGSGNRGGAIEIKIKESLDKPSISFNQDIGAFSYSKTYLRFDSGKIFKNGPKFFTSFSYTDADKWKGEGKLGPRKNFSSEFSQSFKDIINMKFFVNYNSISRHLFKGLTYNEIKNLHKYYYHDFNDIKNTFDYYGYNKFDAINRDYFGIVNFKINNNLSLSVKPYYSKENNTKYEKGFSFYDRKTQKTKYFILNKINNSKRYGLTSQFDYKFKKININGGLWIEKTDFKPIIKKYMVTSLGLKFAGYGWFTKNLSKGKIISPYLKAGLNLNRIKFQIGGKYFYYKEPGKKGYWFKNGKFIYDENISINKKIYNVFLPSFGIEYSLYKNHKISFYYSKRYQRPYAYGPLSSFYFKNYQTFISKKITLQDLFDGLDTEKIDAFDLIYKGNFKNITCFLDLYYQKHKNILVAVEDPRVNLTYQQNDGDAKSYGIDVTSEYILNKNLKIFANASLNKMEFTKNVVRGGKKVTLKGKQFPDSPEYMFKSGIIYNFNNFEFIPVYKYISKRYGDALNMEHVNPYSIVNFQINYYGFNNITLGMEIDNILNHKYVGRIDTWDDSTGNTTYYCSSPFTMMFKVSGRF